MSDRMNSIHTVQYKLAKSCMMDRHFPLMFHSLTLYAQVEKSVVVLPSSTQV